MEKKSEGQILHSEAINLAFNHEQQKALEKIEKALTLEPKNAKFVVEKVEIMCELGKMKEAIALLETSGKNYEPYSEIEKEINKLNKELAYDNITPSDATAKQKLAALMKWGYDNGLDANNMKIVYYGPDFRGVHAARRIRANTPVVVVPEKLLIHCEKINKECPLANKVANCGVKLDYRLATALCCMVYEMKKDPNNWWYHYAESFPVDGTCFPYFFTKEEKEYIKGTSIEPVMKEEIEQSHTEYEALCNEVPELREMSADTYLKLTAFASSRYFSVKGMPDDKIAIPIIDMFNYYIEKSGQTQWYYEPETKTFHLDALVDIQRGEVIGLNYGDKGNSKYLQYYGFIPENNNYTYLYFKTSLNPKDPLLKEKQALLRYYCDETFLTSREFYNTFKKRFNKNLKALSPFRLTTYSGDMKILANALRSPKWSSDEIYAHIKIPPISVTNEIKALQLFKEVTLHKLKDYPTTLEKDQETLKTKEKTLTMNMKNALQARISELKFLNDIVKFVDHMVKFMKLSQKDAEKELAHMPEDLWYKPYAQHITNSILK